MSYMYCACLCTCLCHQPEISTPIDSWVPVHMSPSVGSIPSQLKSGRIYFQIQTFQILGTMDRGQSHIFYWCYFNSFVLGIFIKLLNSSLQYSLYPESFWENLRSQTPLALQISCWNINITPSDTELGYGAQKKSACELYRHYTTQRSRARSPKVCRSCARRTEVHIDAVLLIFYFILFFLLQCLERSAAMQC